MYSCICSQARTHTHTVFDRYQTEIEKHTDKRERQINNKNKSVQIKKKEKNYAASLDTFHWNVLVKHRVGPSINTRPSSVQLIS